MRAPKLIAHPLRPGERAALVAALAKAKLPTADVEAPGRLFWQYENKDEVPVGFGGLEVRGEDALLRSLVTLPSVRNRGVGTAMVAALEFEARLHGCRSLWLITTTAADFFDRLGYARCDRAVVPPAIRETSQFSTLCPASADVLMKRLA
ncbi:MAG TPA: arsenic resistance N-acetyltransferase ArsN2 [Xanthobacteraceae bacterium]|nr:arsenic resistance N-acetyltransferase ArsN2 [Xanthobacteraceae bacterium]